MLLHLRKNNCILIIKNESLSSVLGDLKMGHQNFLMWTHLSYDARVGNFLYSDNFLHNDFPNYLNNFQVLIPNDCRAIILNENKISKFTSPIKEGPVIFNDNFTDSKNVYQIYKSEHDKNQLYSSLSDIVNTYFTTHDGLFKKMSLKCGSIFKLSGFYKNCSPQKETKLNKKTIFCQFIVMQGVHIDTNVTRGLEVYVPLHDKTQFLPLKLCEVGEILGDQYFDAKINLANINEHCIRDKQRNAYDFNYSRKKYENIRANLLLYHANATPSDKGHKNLPSYLLFYDDTLKNTTVYLHPRMEIKSLAIITNFAFNEEEIWQQFRIGDSLYYTELWDSRGKDVSTQQQQNTLKYISNKYQCKIEQLTRDSNDQSVILEIVKHLVSVPKLLHQPLKVPNSKILSIPAENHDRNVDYYILRSIHRQPLIIGNDKVRNSALSSNKVEVNSNITDALSKIADSLYHNAIELNLKCDKVKDQDEKAFTADQFDHTRPNNDYFYMMGSLAEGLEI